MKKLKQQVFFTIFLILTISLFSFIFVFNIQNYNQEKQTIINNLDQISSISQKIEENNKPNTLLDENDDIDNIEKNNDLQGAPEDMNVVFMDSIVYTVLLDKYNHVKDVINHSQNNMTYDEIENIATNILENDDFLQTKIGNLYFDDYSYSYLEGKSLIILDNSIVKARLFSYLQTSAIICVILECILFFVSYVITKWIIQPVKISFDKQKQFIADASHELKTPLSVIIASSDALQDNPLEKKWLNYIKNEANRMNDLITDLLELAQSENEIQKIFKVGDLSKIVELSVLTFEGKTFEKNLQLEYDIEDHIKMNMDENSIKQLLEILLDNAIKHSQSHGKIQVFLKQKDNEICLEVKNQGQSIPDGEEEKIFERFYRVDKSRNRADNRYGLGLAIAKNIVENHQGKITAKSNQELTTFQIILKKA